MPRMPTGKVPWSLVSRHVRGALPPEVLLGPALGEDAALVRFGDQVWAVASDPISFTAREAGRLAVIVNANDVAVRGARPRLFLVTVLIAPAEASEDRVAEVLSQVRTACDQLQVSLIGGHTEVTPGLEHTLVVGAMLGPVVGRPVTTGGLRPGDLVGITGWAGLEGTLILAGEHADRLDGMDAHGLLASLEPAVGADWLNVVPEALAAAACPHVSALHDVTEGGVAEALSEMATASGVGLEVRLGAVPVLPATRWICDLLALDPLGLLGSGALVVGCAADGADDLVARLAAVGTRLTWIGHATEPSAPSTALPRFPRDEIVKAVAAQSLSAILFDMDGTLIDSDYDWSEIRRRLRIDQPSIIDALNGLQGAERSERWTLLRAAEEDATRGAGIKPGAIQLLELAHDRGLRTALVTNNSEVNTRRLLDRFGLEFDVVITRDCGLWKPSGAPLLEAMRRLGVPPERCASVGDSSFDIQASREAGCGLTILVGGGPGAGGDPGDLRLPDLEALLRLLQAVL